MTDIIQFFDLFVGRSYSVDFSKPDYQYILAIIFLLFILHWILKLSFGIVKGFFD